MSPRDRQSACGRPPGSRRVPRMARDGSLEEQVHDWMVRWLAERKHELLSRVDVGTRYDVLAQWASCELSIGCSFGPGRGS